MSETSVDARLDGLFERLTAMFDRWLTEFEQRPVAMTIKIMLVLWCVRWARRHVL